MHLWMFVKQQNQGKILWKVPPKGCIEFLKLSRIQDDLLRWFVFDPFFSKIHGVLMDERWAPIATAMTGCPKLEPWKMRFCSRWQYVVAIPLHIYNRIYILILIQVPMRRYRKTNNNCSHNLDYIMSIHPFYQQTFSPYDHSELYQEPPNPFQSRLSYTCNTIPHKKTPIDVASGDALDSWGMAQGPLPSSGFVTASMIKLAFFWSWKGDSSQCACEVGELVLSAIVPPAFAPYEGGIDSVIGVDLSVWKSSKSLYFHFDLHHYDSSILVILVDIVTSLRSKLCQVGHVHGWLWGLATRDCSTLCGWVWCSDSLMSIDETRCQICQVA